MLWFEGSIPDAILTSKQRKLPFVVYVEGKDELSIKMNGVWDDPQITELLSKEKCVAIKLMQDSEQCSQFSQLYPVVCVPSTFFIGDSGMPLEVLGGLVTVGELIAKTNAAYEAYHSHKAEVVSDPVQLAGPSGDQNTAAGVGNEGSSNQTSTSASIEEQVERAKKLIEQKREEKLEKEKQEQLEEEIRRRNEGQELLDAKRKREEKNQRELVNQIRQDRAKDRAAREAVKQQIARDKAEREAHRQTELRERSLAQASEENGTAAASVGRTADHTFVRLQFRLPDGSCVTNTFPEDALLEAARQFIVTHVGSRYNSIAMSTTYPRRQLTDQDMMQSLTALGLAPSSTLLISPGNSHAPATNSDSSASWILMWLLAPLFAIMNFIKVFLFGAPDAPKGSYGGNAHQGREEIRPSQRQPGSSGVRKRAANESTEYKDGNIHRFRNPNDDDDDENNTWNGNSTQQM